MTVALKDIDITQESVDEFFDDIHTAALADSLRMSTTNSSTMQENCPYCHDQKDIINTLDHSRVVDIAGMAQPGQVVHIYDNRLICEEQTIESRKINFCPMCGRSLNEEKER